MTECTFLNKKIILTEPIPGQEEINEKYFVGKGLAIKLDKKKTSAQIKNLLELLKNSKPPNLSTSNETILNISLN